MGPGRWSPSSVPARARAADLAAAHGLTVVNDNAPDQVVVAGPADACLGLLAAGDEELRMVRLPIVGAFHTESMRPAADAVRRSLGSIALGEPRMPVYSSASGRPFRNPLVELASNICAPVRWHDTVQALVATGVRRWIDCGPGPTLGRLVRPVVADADVTVVDTATPL